MTRFLPTTRPAQAAPPTSGPRRLLLVTGGMGAGHHSAARAVEERAREVWPGVEVVWTDTLDDMGAGPLFRGVYAGCVRLLPWLYALYFWLLCAVPPFHAAVRAVIARWSARGLAPVLERERPDLVVATFPEGVAGLGRLRRRGRLPMPAVALVADPAPHPLWLDDALDLHLVSTAAGADRLGRFAPHAAVRVAAVPVVRSFAAPEQRPVHLRPKVLVSFGSLGFGDPVAAAAAALDAGADVVVSTSRRARVRRGLDRLAARHPHGGRLTVLDWIADPAATLRDTDALVTNAGGATALEAVASGTVLLLFDPIPGHGRANAEVLAAAALATVCGTAAELRRAVGDLGARAQRAVPDTAWAGAAPDFAADVAALATLAAPDRPRSGDRLRAQDALFVHAATQAMPQQVGARIHIADPDQRDDWAEHLAALIRTRAPGIDLLCRRLAPGRTPRWRTGPAPDPAVHLRPEVIEVEGTAAADAALTDFLAEPVDPVTTGWRLQVALDRAAGELIVLAAFHHALGDGLAITDALAALLTDEMRTPIAAVTRRSGAGRSGAGRSGAGSAAATVVRGCAGLALAGPAGASALTGTTAGPLVLHTLRLDAARVRAVARAHGVGTTALLLAALADALHAVLAERAAEPGPTAHVRAMVPMTARTRAAVGSRAPGNRTAAMPVDLPVGAMDGRARVVAVATALTAGNRKGLPAATTAALRVLGLLPTPVQARTVRMIYGRRFFHVLASVMPGARRRLHIRGGLLRDIYPALPLAPGVGIAFGALACGEGIGVGLTVDSAIVPEGADLTAHLAAALDRMEHG
ncbi:MAG TPA: WS/DGAT domain-containing protein [Pseudonocardia sp.]